VPVAKNAADSASRLAQESRNQDRLAQAYFALSELAADWLLWSFDVRPYVTSDANPTHNAPLAVML
jgi:hypothetical protein